MLLYFDPVGAFVWGVVAGTVAGVIFWTWAAIELIRTAIKNKRRKKQCH